MAFLTGAHSNFFTREYTLYQLKEPMLDANGDFMYTKTGKLRTQPNGEIDYDKLYELGWFGLMS